MKLRNAFAALIDIRGAVQIALFPTLCAIFKNPLILFHPVALSRIFMSHVWAAFGNGLDINNAELKAKIITSDAQGVVLDVGAGESLHHNFTYPKLTKITLGFGHTARYLDRTKVTVYVALEPNEHMHKEIKRNANGAGFIEEDGTLLIIPHGAESSGLLTSALGGLNTVDTIISVLTLCTVPEPEKTIDVLVKDVLKPGGKFLYYEHVRSHRKDVAWWQWFWTPLWKLAFDGCCLDRPTDQWLEKVGVWESKDLWCKDGEEENLWWHSGGKLVKA